jgi:primosomal protein N' (replication factor Y) (superfamily II helicase)
LIVPALTILRVALDVPLRRVFDYLPPLTDGTVSIGARVKVPFGSRQLVGWIVGLADHSTVSPSKLRRATELLDSNSVLDAGTLALVEWTASYYHHPIGEVLAAAVPRALRTGSILNTYEQRWRITPTGRDALKKGLVNRAPKQQALLQLLLTHNYLTATALQQFHEKWQPLARALTKKKWLEKITHAVIETQSTVTSPPLGSSEPVLTQEQRHAVEEICKTLQQFKPVVLHGVTGSGKTEVYMQVAKHVVANDQSVLILVPEISLTPQLVARFAERFGVAPTVMHSALTDRERLRAWQHADRGQAKIVLGTRSAVFCSMPKLGMIIVDEEHDASLKQHEGGFRYSARDIAVRRAQQTGIPIVLGSATPSLETLYNINTQRYHCLTLSRRSDQAPAPRLQLIDLKNEHQFQGISHSVVQAITRHLQQRGQVLIFLNRRGYAPTLLCTACSWLADCPSCDAKYTVHQSAEKLRCHHCGNETSLPETCPQCGYAVKPVGRGTERVSETLRTLFPDVPLVRMDRDAVTNRRELESALNEVKTGNARILLGTQMIAKGHDFPDVTLVVILNADQGLFSTDFRAAERLAQTVIQVAGRAGRASRSGEVLLQTEYPEHPLLKNLLTEGYSGFAASALQERAQAAWPPYSHLVALRCSASQAKHALDFLNTAKELANAPKNIQLRGPVPAAMAKRADKYHAQLLLESTQRRSLHQFIDDWLTKVDTIPQIRQLSWVLDVDPAELF